MLETHPEQNNVIPHVNNGQDCYREFTAKGDTVFQVTSLASYLCDKRNILGALLYCYLNVLNLKRNTVEKDYLLLK